MGRKPLYDWENWFKRKRITLRFGEHYDCSQSAIIQQIRNRAGRRGLGVHIDEGLGWLTVTLGKKGKRGRRKMADTALAVWPHIAPGPERKERCRMLDAALDLLWRRTGAGAGRSLGRYQTDAAARDFLGRHPKLIECVDVLHRLNTERGRAISSRGLSAGACSALLYLMGSAESDRKKYLAGQPQPTEKRLDWSRWDKAVKFFEHLARGRMEAVKREVKKLTDIEGGQSSQLVEKNAILVKAWLAYLETGKVTKTDVELEWRQVDVFGTMAPLVEGLKVGGIDFGEPNDPTAGTGAG